MTSSIHFMRHFSLVGKFSDYNQLTFEELRNLWLDIWEYHIDQEFKYLNDYDLSLPCYTSEQLRTYETASKIGFTSIHQKKYLDELHFDLSNIITQEEFKEWWLKSVRNKFWQSFFARNPAIESSESVMQRLEEMIVDFRKNPEQNIIAITHWFLIQLIECFLIKKVDFRNISYKEFLNLDIAPLQFGEKIKIEF